MSKRRFGRSVFGPLELGRGDTLGGDASLLLLNQLKKGHSSKLRRKSFGASYHSGFGIDGTASNWLRRLFRLFILFFVIIGLGALALLIWPDLLPVLERVVDLVSRPLFEFYDDFGRIGD